MILTERRRFAIGGPLLKRVGLAWLLICVLLLATNFAAVAALRFPDPDDTLRLIEVRDLLGGQGWFDLHQHRIDAAHGGVPMHWSRLVDLPIAATILLLTPLLGAQLAENAALVLVPLLTFGCALLLIGRIAWRMFDLEVAGLSCLVLALSVPVVAQLRPLRIDHHGWQIVAALVVVNGLMARSARAGGWIAGLAMAVWLAISLEGLPLAAVLAGIAALRWWRDRNESALLVNLMLGLASGSALLFLGTRGLADLAQHCDAISPVHLAIFAWGAAVLAALAALRRRSWMILLGGFALAGGGALVLVASLAPQCARGAFVELDPVVRRFWYDSVGEGLPVWHQPLGLALQCVIPPLVGLVASWRLARQTADPWLRRWWFDYTLLLGAALAIAVAVSRASAVAGALAAVPLAWQLREWIAAVRSSPGSGRKIAIAAGLILALQPALPVIVWTAVVPASAAEAGAYPPVSSCSVAAAAPVLNRLPQGAILAPLDIGPELLYATRHSVVATSHHRAAKAMREVIDAFTGSADAAHAAISKRGVDYVALCPDLAEPALYVDVAPDALAAQLVAGHAPEWLKPIPLPGDSTFRIWRVIH